VQPSQHSLDLYYLGLKIFEDIENRWDNPTPEEREGSDECQVAAGKKMFEVRENDADISFIRNYLTKDLVKDLDLYVFEKKGPE